jgi:hypothetical protein
MGMRDPRADIGDFVEQFGVPDLHAEMLGN